MCVLCSLVHSTPWSAIAAILSDPHYLTTLYFSSIYYREHIFIHGYTLVSLLPNFANTSSQAHSFFSLLTFHPYWAPVPFIANSTITPSFTFLQPLCYSFYYEVALEQLQLNERSVFRKHSLKHEFFESDLVTTQIYMSKYLRNVSMVLFLLCQRNQQTFMGIIINKKTE